MMNPPITDLFSFAEKVQSLTTLLKKQIDDGFIVADANMAELLSILEQNLQIIIGSD